MLCNILPAAFGRTPRSPIFLKHISGCGVVGMMDVVSMWLQTDSIPFSPDTVSLKTFFKEGGLDFNTLHSVDAGKQSKQGEC